MSWRIAVKHLSRYRYGEPAIASHNELRMTPQASGHQHVIEERCAITPASSLYRYVDYWGTIVHAFDLHEPHEVLEIVSSCTVETAPPPPRPTGASWAELSDPALRDRFTELLAATAYAPLAEEILELAQEAATGCDPTEAVDAISERVRGALRYEQGSTGVTTSALEAWTQRSGVCQDFAHLSLALLRSLGIPARYVSGYLYPTADATIGEVAVGASHAWVEAFTGWWQPFDPTNGAPVGERHVTVATGRDYRDVTPFRGVYRGGALASLDVEVTLARLA